MESKDLKKKPVAHFSQNPSSTQTAATGHHHEGGRRKSAPSQKEKGKSSRKVSVNRPAKEHAFLTDVADVRTMEHGLLSLLNDFHSGKLQAFGNSATFNKMDAIRVQQEQLARQHFELDLVPRTPVSMLSTEESRKKNNEKMDKLIEQLHGLSTSVQTLQTDLGTRNS